MKRTQTNIILSYMYDTIQTITNTHNKTGNLDVIYLKRKTETRLSSKRNTKY